jgi:hypothetical protein
VAKAEVLRMLVGVVDVEYSTRRLHRNYNVDAVPIAGSPSS